MPSFSCSVCFDCIASASTPMSTLCGHIYCLTCATFCISTYQSCAVCRAPQALEQLVRLFPQWEGEEKEIKKDASHMREDDSVCSSPVSVRIIDQAAEEAVVALKSANADRQNPREALLTCNTLVNSVPPCEVPHINTELLDELSFQLKLMSTKMMDESERLNRLRQNAQSARASETRLNLRVEQQRNTMNRFEKEKADLASQCGMLEKDNALLLQQCVVSGENAHRERVRTAKAESELDALNKEKEMWKQKAVKVTKKYHALKNKVEETKRSAALLQQGQVRDRSEDLIIL